MKVKFGLHNGMEVPSISKLTSLPASSQDKMQAILDFYKIIFIEQVDKFPGQERVHHVDEDIFKVLMFNLFMFQPTTVKQLYTPTKCII